MLADIYAANTAILGIYMQGYDADNPPGAAYNYYVNDTGHENYPFHFSEGIFITGDQPPIDNNYFPRYELIDLETGEIPPNNGLVNFIGEIGEGYYDASDLVKVVQALNND